MKKILTIALALVSLAFISCQKDPIGGTATQEVSGQWYVQADGVDASGNLPADEYADVYGIGNFLVLTYNTSANTENEIFVDDLGNFWDFKLKVACNLAAKTFGNSGEVPNLNYDCNVWVRNGKIVPNGTKTPSGMPADYIEFEVGFDDDEDAAELGFDHYKIHGFRYTGFVADE
ncbi:MAG: hypothetical protein IJU34_06920 [Bacteroidales bacterium]|nr:hypothetical protein [Bacteroidales bacterium]